MLSVKDFRTHRYLVLENLRQEDFACICGKFQKDGILCAHILRVPVHLNKSVLPGKYYIERWKPKDRKYVRHKQFNIPMELIEAGWHLRYAQLSNLLNEMASDGAGMNEKYLFVVKESERIFTGLDEMNKAEELRELQARGVAVGKGPLSQVQVPHPDVYDTLQDPDVVVSKGRPKSRYLTTREKILSKKQNKCSHYNSHDHNIASCHNLHIDKSEFQKKKLATKKPTSTFF
uniref:Protein FAR1-RELATED SEQUENCE n=1 Tax=Aegilops tauschii subsp. strangulata TaxID=200361 RepID=A0A452ZAA3_AEGTS